MATLGCSNITVLLTIFIVIIISSSQLSRHHHNLIRVAEVGNREAKKTLKVFGERATKMTDLKVFVTKCCFKILAGMLHPRYLNMNPFVKISPKAFLKARNSQQNFNSGQNVVGGDPSFRSDPDLLGSATSALPQLLPPCISSSLSSKMARYTVYLTKTRSGNCQPVMIISKIAEAAKI